MMAKKSPTARTLEACRKLGWLIDVTERTLGRFVKKDLFGFADLVAIIPCFSGATFIQVTSVGNRSARTKKILDECTEQAKIVLSAGNRIEIWGWGRYSWMRKDGTKATKKRWDATRLEVVLQGTDMVAIELPRLSELRDST